MKCFKTISDHLFDFGMLQIFLEDFDDPGQSREITNFENFGVGLKAKQMRQHSNHRVTMVP